MNTKKSIPSKTKKLIFQEAESHCPFCGQSDVDVLEIHHIIEQAEGGSHEPENLILVCSNCHSRITNGSISLNEVMAMKSRLSSSPGKHPTNGKPANVINITGGEHSGVIANVVHLKTPGRRSPKLAHPQGAIGSNLLFRNYAKYLIDRYNEFKRADKTVRDFSFAVIYRSIKSHFKETWDFIPLERFTELVSFLQNHIDGTILGKVRKKRGQGNYETFEEFKAKQSPKSDKASL